MKVHFHPYLARSFFQPRARRSMPLLGLRATKASITRSSFEKLIRGYLPSPLAISPQSHLRGRIHQKTNLARVLFLARASRSPPKARAAVRKGDRSSYENSNIQNLAHTNSRMQSSRGYLSGPFARSPIRVDVKTKGHTSLVYFFHPCTRGPPACALPQMSKISRCGFLNEFKKKSKPPS